MRKVLAGILIFDVIMGILCLVVGTRQYAGNRQLDIREEKFPGLRETLAGDVNCEEELAQKIALTFDDDVIIGLSQEISYKEAVSMI